MPLIPQNFCRPPCGVTLEGKCTSHRFEEKYLQIHCFSVQSPGSLLGDDGPYTSGDGVGCCPWKQALHPEPSKETPMKVSPVQSEQRHLQSKGQP